MTTITPQAGVGLPETQDPFRREIVVPLDLVEWRDSGDAGRKNETTLRGHAAIFNSLSEDLGGFRELIEPGFFRSALRKKPDVRLLFNHDPNFVLARTASKTLELREDARGLHVFATVDKTIGWVKDLRISMQRGDIDQMSFAFTLVDGADENAWTVTEDGTIVRTLRADMADELFDTSVVTYPAYRATHVDMRSALESAITLGRLPAEAVEAISTVAPELVGSAISSQRTLGEQRADMPSLQLLMHMYECAQQFCEAETEPDDGPDVEAMTRIMGELEALIGVEAAEPNPPGALMEMSAPRVTPEQRQTLQEKTAVALAEAQERRRDSEARKYQFTATRKATI